MASKGMRSLLTSLQWFLKGAWPWAIHLTRAWKRGAKAKFLWCGQRNQTLTVNKRRAQWPFRRKSAWHKCLLFQNNWIMILFYILIRNFWEKAVKLRCIIYNIILKSYIYILGITSLVVYYLISLSLLLGIFFQIKTKSINR